MSNETGMEDERLRDLLTAAVARSRWDYPTRATGLTPEALYAAVEKHEAGAAALSRTLERGILSDMPALNEPLTNQQAKVEQWVKDHAYAEDDIVLGDGLNYDLICEDVRGLLDLVHPQWRTVFDKGGSG